MGYLDVAKAIHEELFPPAKAQVRACAPAEIAQLENQVGSALPAAYREFLLWMGKYGGDFWKGHAAFYAELIEINQWARDLVQSSQELLRLPPNAFAFFWDFGQLFYFFELSGDEDPPIYFFMDPNLEEVIRQTDNPAKLAPAQSFLSYLWKNEPRTKFVLRANHFSECLAAEIEDHARFSITRGLWK